MTTRRIWFARALALLMVGPVTLALGGSRERSSTKHVGVVPERPAIALRASLLSRSTPADELIRFAVTIANAGPIEVQALWLGQGASVGYNVTELCVWNGTAPSCQRAAADAAGGLSGGQPKLPIAPKLQPGQSMVVSGSLRVPEPLSPRSVTAIVGWSAAGNPPSQATVLLGEVKQAEAGGFMSSSFYKALKDLMLPLVLLALPFLFQALARRRAQMDQTWNLMLPQSYKLMTGNYMSLDGELKNIFALADRHRETGAPAWSDDETTNLLYHLSLFGKRQRSMGQTVGGFYFKNRMGEILASGCLHSYSKLFLKGTGVKAEYSALLSRVKLNETFDAFLQKLGPLPPQTSATPVAGAAAPSTLAPSGGPGAGTVLAPVPIFRTNWDNLQRWLATADSAQALDYLRGLHAVLRLEMNRPFENWYDSKEALEIDKDTMSFLKAHADEIAEGYQIRDFKRQLQYYLNASLKDNWLVKRGLRARLQGIWGR